MAKIEAAEGLQSEVQRTQQNFDSIKQWTDRQGRSYGTDVIILQVAAALETNELAVFKATYDLLKESKAASGLLQGTKGGTVPGWTRSEHSFEERRYPSIDGCLLAALEIVKKNRANSPRETEQVAAIADLQAEVRANLEDKK
ncbi:MAG: hypothetical protein WC924_02245 [Candidatus Gracilibacteria bacterium]